MTMNAGGIKYDIEVSTVELLQAEAVVDKSLDKQTKAFTQADTKVRDYEKSQKMLGRTIGSTGIVMNKNNKVLVEQTKRYRELTLEATKSHEALMRQTQAAQGVQRGMAGAGQAATNLSYQIQDIAVQMQLGMNGFMIAAQQLPQMLVGMGAIAAGIGAAVAVAGGLAMAFIDTRSEAEKLESQLEKVKAVITLSATGVANYSDEMMRLAKISEQLAKVKLAATLREQEEALRQSAAVIKDVWSEQGTIFSNTNKTIAKELKVNIGVINEFDSAISGIGFNPTAEQVERLEVALVGLQAAGGDVTKEGRELINSTADMIQKFKEGEITAEALRASIDDIGEVSNNTAERTKTLADNLNLSLMELEKGKRAAFEYSLTLEGLDETQRKELLTIYDKIQAKKQETKEQKELNKEIDEYAKYGEKLLQDEEKRKQSLSSRGKTIGLTDNEVFKMQLEEQHTILKEMLDARLLTEDEYIQRRNNLYSEANNELSQMWGTLENQAIGTLASIATGAQDGKEAIRGLASSIATQLVGALIKMGIQAMIGQSAAVASGTATAAALSSAYATPAALASLASYGANAGPAQAGIATTVATTNALAIGGREMGGPVSAGSMYRVGERGPEIFSAGGKNFMIPGESGQVVNNKDAFGGGSNVNIVVNNNAPNTQATASQDSSGNIEVVISAISDQVMSGQGKFARALRQGTNTTFKAGV